MINYYAPDGSVLSRQEWSSIFAGDRHVGNTMIKLKGRKIQISTVWIGIDYNVNDEPPMIFETMIFGLGEDEPTDRYSTYQEAREAHLSIVDGLISAGGSLVSNDRNLII